jgi:hypothetical protein
MPQCALSTMFLKNKINVSTNKETAIFWCQEDGLDKVFSNLLARYINILDTIYKQTEPSKRWKDKKQARYWHGGRLLQFSFCHLYIHTHTHTHTHVFKYVYGKKKRALKKAITQKCQLVQTKQ